MGLADPRRMSAAGSREESTWAASTGRLDGQEDDVQPAAFNQTGIHQECCEFLEIEQNFQPIEPNHDAVKELHEDFASASQSGVQQECPTFLVKQDCQPLELRRDEALEQNPIEHAAVDEAENVLPNTSVEDDTENGQRGDSAVPQEQDVRCAAASGMTRLHHQKKGRINVIDCLLYTSDAADE